jgi:hypothetical protein
MIKRRRMSLAGYVAVMGTSGMYIGFWWENQKDRVFQEDLYVGGRIILKSILDNIIEIVWT